MTLWPLPMIKDGDTSNGPISLDNIKFLPAPDPEQFIDEVVYLTMTEYLTGMDAEHTRKFNNLLISILKEQTMPKKAMPKGMPPKGMHKMPGGHMMKDDEMPKGMPMMKGKKGKK